MSRRGKLLRRLLGGYLAVGFVLSFVQNLWARFAGEPTAFAWAGSLSGTVLLLFWWLVVPALIWPWNLYWTAYHRWCR